MNLHQRIGVIFSVFSAIALAFNILTPSNPDFWTNVFELTAMTILMAMTTFMSMNIGGVIQISGLVVCAALAPDSQGSPFFSAFIIIFCLVLLYAYNGYKTNTILKAGISAVVVFVIMFSSLSKYDQPLYELFLRSIIWSSFIYVFAYVLWVIAEDIDNKFHRYKESELLRINRELIKLNHDILDSGGCHDATGKPSGI